MSAGVTTSRPDRLNLVYGDPQPVLGDLTGRSERALTELRSQFGLVSQQAALVDWLSVRGNVALPLVEDRSISTAEVTRRVDEALRLLDLTDISAVMPEQLSLAQRNRVRLARAIVTRPDVLIYDEPSTGLGPLPTRELDVVIQQMQEHLEVTSIVISQDMASMLRIADRIAVLQDGAIVAVGTPAEIRASRNEYVQQLLEA